MSAPWRKHLTTLVLTAAALAAGVAVLWVDRGTVTTGEAEQRRKSLFEVWRADEVTEIEIDLHGEKAKIFRGATTDAGQRPWEVELGGARFAAEAPVVDQLLGALDMASVERRIPEGSVDRAAFGLDKPRLRIAVSMGRQHLALRIGGAAPTPADAVYAEVEGKGVVVVTRQLAAALEVEPAALRSRTLVPYSAGDLGALLLDGEGGPRHLTREGPGAARGAGFRFDGSTPEGQVRATSVAMERILGALGDLGADAYLTDAEVDRALARKVTLTLVPRDRARPRAVIDLGGACPGHPDEIVALRKEPDRAAACVSSGALDAFLVPAADLVDRRLLSAPADEIVELLLTGQGKKIELARKGPQWHMRAPVDRPLEAEAGRAFLDALLDVEADHLVPSLDLKSLDLKALGLDPPRAVLRVLSTPAASGADGGVEERNETLEIGGEQGEFVLIRRTDDGAVAAVPKDRAAPLFPDELALRSKKLFDEPVARVRGLRVEGGGRVQRFGRTAAGAYTLLEPKGEGLNPDLGLCADLVQLVTTLTVDRWVGPGDDKAYGLAAPRLSIEVELGGEGSEGKTLRVLLGAAASSGSFARAAGEDAVFVAPRALEDAASRWLLDRGSLRIDAETIKTATLTAPGGKKLVVEQAGGVFRVAGAGADPASAARAATIRDALADLSAETAVGVGKPEKHHGLDAPRLTIVIDRQNPLASDKLPPARLVVGAGDSVDGTSIFYVRRDRIDATWAVAQAKIRPLLEALGEK